ncbi:DUF1461 domain-containing protein [Candidatus Woesearchaeota archaeon]|nr:DUF1461 domain-containing protein [Candidatus Woesearchaeota archaeon]
MPGKRRESSKGQKTCVSSFTAMVVLAVSLFVLSYTLAFHAVAFSEGYYFHEFSKRETPAVARFYMQQTSEILSYFRYGQEFDILPGEYYTLKERLHMVDVKNIVQNVLVAEKMSVLLAFAMGFWLVSALGKEKGLEKIGKSLRAGGYAVLGLAAVVIISFWDFAELFGRFHLAFFQGDTWMLSMDDLLIEMYPESFFFRTGMMVFLLAIIYGIGMLLLGKKLGGLFSAAKEGKRKKHK